MFITKKHMSRRTILRGAGVALALPLLDSMLPAQTLDQQDGGESENSLHRYLYPARRGAWMVGAGGRRPRRTESGAGRQAVQVPDDL